MFPRIEHDEEGVRSRDSSRPDVIPSEPKGDLDALPGNTSWFLATFP